MASGVPWSSILTEPSHSFRTQPVRPSSSAILREVQRKPTPWTWPTKCTAQRLNAFLSSSAMAVSFLLLHVPMIPKCT